MLILGKSRSIEKRGMEQSEITTAVGLRGIGNETISDIPEDSAADGGPLLVTALQPAQRSLQELGPSAKLQPELLTSAQLLLCHSHACGGVVNTGTSVACFGYTTTSARR